MNELRAIVDTHRIFGEEGKRSVLLTLVDVEGSSYRRPGAKMLVDDEGRTAGFIGGGCLGGDLAEHARQVLESGQPKTISYDLSDPGELAWGLGVGCPGTITIFLEPVDEELADRLGQWARLEEPVATFTVYQTGEESRFNPGERWAVRSDGTLEGLSPDDPIAESIREEGMAAIGSRRSAVKAFGEGPEAVKILVNYLQLPQRLVVFGSGQDTAAMIRFADELRWEATVVDSEAGEGGIRQYPEPVTVVAGDPVKVFKDLVIDERTAVVVMSHNFQRDRALLDLLVSSSSPYIGLLGSSSRRDSLLSKLAPENRENLQGRLFAPVGLDIGGDRPEEVALAVVAEIQAVFTARGGGFLRNRESPIHDRVDKEAGAG